MLSKDIRKIWYDFWKTKEHNELKPANLFPEKDKTALFTVAGMQQLVPYLCGKTHKNGSKLFNIQKCIRTVDIDEIGDERHCTMFEMMGNWSLGSYYKQESIKWSVEFLTKYCNIPIEKIGATIFAGDEKTGISNKDKQARNILNEAGIANERIRELKDNWWSAGDVGPCGLDCEFYYDRGEKFGVNDWLMDDNDRYIEIWNNVFMSYYKEENGNLSELNQKNVDTGMGLERLSMILQDKKTIFETDLFFGMLKIIEEYTNINYTPFYKEKFNKLEDDLIKKFRIIADHIRASLFLIGDNVLPSNEGRGYVLRRLIRRSFYNMYLLNKNIDYKKTIEKIYDWMEKTYGIARDNLKNNKQITKIFINEINKFEKTIQKGIKMLDNLIEEKDGKCVLDGEIAFKLYDTYGFPLELTKEICNIKSLKVDEKGFKENMQKAKEKSKENAKTVFKRGIDWASFINGISPTKFVGYDNLSLESVKVLKYFEVEDNKVYIFDKTPFYAEGGGQTADKGKLILDDGNELHIKDVQNFAGVYLHFVK